ncbi:hypothetical protein MRX96_009882 [Rhipicephalus microplus]
MRGREGNLPALGSVQSKLERTQLQGSLNLAPKLVPPYLPLPAPSVGFASRVALFFFVFGLGSFSWPGSCRVGPRPSLAAINFWRERFPLFRGGCTVMQKQQPPARARVLPIYQRAHCVSSCPDSGAETRGAPL